MTPLNWNTSDPTRLALMENRPAPQWSGEDPAQRFFHPATPEWVNSTTWEVRRVGRSFRRLRALVLLSLLGNVASILLAVLR